MKEGFYWVSYAGQKLVAWYTKEETRHHETGELITGVWRVAGPDNQIATPDEIVVLEGPLAPPAE